VRAGTAACTGQHYCAESSRTTALAQLKDGRILLFASQWPAVRREVGKWLAEELGAVEALNLDGGPEATLALRGEAPEDSIGTQGVGLPMVLLVLPP
jgi:exopolysaccharide biosynthesis protein